MTLNWKAQYIQLPTGYNAWYHTVVN